MLIVLCILCSFILIFVLLDKSQENSRRAIYIIIITTVLLILLFAYRLNLSGHYPLATGLTIFSAIIGVWLSIVFDKNIIAGDFVPLIYTIIPVYLASLFLSTKLTLLITLFQFIILFLFPFVLPTTSTINWSSLLSFFLMASGISIMINIINREDMQQIDQQTLQIMENSRQLQQAAIRDHLTGLFNRRYMVVTLERELHRALRENAPLGILMMDIDHFKEINDLFGHAAGDLVLQTIGACLQECTRKSDIACRFGGEEFVVIMPGANQEVSCERAQILRKKATEFRMEFEGQTIQNISVSIGIAIFPQHGVDQDRLLINADKALYQAKRAGRDRVMVYDPTYIDAFPDRL